MRILLVLITVVLAGCASHLQTLDWYQPAGSEFIGPVAETDSGKTGYSLLDRQLLSTTSDACKLAGSSIDPSDMDDSAKNVQARWIRLNCRFWQSRPRALAVFLDGTGNTKKDQTNVWRLYTLAYARALQGDPVVPYYDRGVGTNFQRFTGSVFGNGLEENVRQAYRFLIAAYRPGDKIYLFGFSRGAFTARTLNGLVEYAGLPVFNEARGPVDAELLKREYGRLFEQTTGLFRQYTELDKGEANFSGRLAQKLKLYEQAQGMEVNRVIVEAIGVFDTVPAFGFWRNDDPDDHRLELYARRGYHAMAIDEQRNDFRLVRFGIPRARNQTLKEVWFAGAHADVGGGYYPILARRQPAPMPCGSAIGLEGVALHWMLKQFADDRLFAMDNLPAGDSRGKLHDELFDGSFSAIYSAAGIYRRQPNEKDFVHRSAIDRYEAGELPCRNVHREPDGIYRPVNLGETPAFNFRIEG
ncbi:hypothetical protein PIGHUM_00358 [Pigmentiphaga humi]|uniref:T6SS Phospholipase effector Tle1-like catalytic domain-containing protein n=1 Tax=Pigmentiphaga humi TaxID=2478468 RepID=A0A3P4AW98_9BURK|nr:DUF2235 domain-containing protein [Pigmentiphaga humi]VCU68307.1 hypothetical protein PIGHUM_00358 [Pigmentiphaga humi]